MDNRSNEYISEALRIADDLMDLANDEAGLADEGRFGILLAVCRDCAYKIRHYAEHDGRKAKIACVNVVLVIFAAAVLSILFASPVGANTIILSTDSTETLGGLTFTDGALAEYNPSTDSATPMRLGSRRSQRRATIACRSPWAMPKPRRLNCPGTSAICRVMFTTRARTAGLTIG